MSHLDVSHMYAGKPGCGTACADGRRLLTGGHQMFVVTLRDPCGMRVQPRSNAASARIGWNSSMGLPAGSSRMICLPPTPVMMSLRNRAQFGPHAQHDSGQQDRHGNEPDSRRAVPERIAQRRQVIADREQADDDRGVSEQRVQRPGTRHLTFT
jgi:hypothetical protein